jgi:hypothetical protein
MISGFDDFLNNEIMPDGHTDTSSISNLKNYQFDKKIFTVLKVEELDPRIISNITELSHDEFSTIEFFANLFLENFFMYIDTEFQSSLTNPLKIRYDDYEILHDNQGVKSQYNSLKLYININISIPQLLINKLQSYLDHLNFIISQIKNQKFIEFFHDEIIFYLDQDQIIKNEKILRNLMKFYFFLRLLLKEDNFKIIFKDDENSPFYHLDTIFNEEFLSIKEKYYFNFLKKNFEIKPENPYSAKTTVEKIRQIYKFIKTQNHDEVVIVNKFLLNELLINLKENSSYKNEDTITILKSKNNPIHYVTNEITNEDKYPFDISMMGQSGIGKTFSSIQYLITNNINPNSQLRVIYINYEKIHGNSALTITLLYKQILLGFFSSIFMQNNTDLIHKIKDVLEDYCWSTNKDDLYEKLEYISDSDVDVYFKVVYKVLLQCLNHHHDQHLARVLFIIDNYCDDSPDCKVKLLLFKLIKNEDLKGRFKILHFLFRNQLLFRSSLLYL